MNIPPFFQERKNLTALVIFLFLLMAIPLTLYLVRQQQIFKGRAIGSSIEFIGLSGNPPQTSNQNVQLKLTYGGTTTTPPPPPPVAPPPPPPPPVSQGSLTVTNLPSQTRSDGIVLLKLGVNWTNLISPFGSLYMVSNITSSGETFAQDITSATGSYTFTYTRASSLYNSQVKFKIKRDGVDILTSNTIIAGSGTSVSPAPPPPPPSTSSCARNGQFCNGTTNCCSGLDCNGYTGGAGSSGTCGYPSAPPPPPPPPSTTTSCRSYGSSCTLGSAECCSPYDCVGFGAGVCN